MRSFVAAECCSKISNSNVVSAIELLRVAQNYSYNTNSIAMGGQQITTKIISSNANPSPNSRIQPSPTFLADLITSLNGHLQYPIQITNNPSLDISTLIESLELLTRHEFTETFTYPYSSKPSLLRPPQLSKPSLPICLSELVSCPVTSPSRINGYILSSPASLSIPRAYSRHVAADLYTAIRGCLERKMEESDKGVWKTERYHRVYEEKLGIMSNYAVDAVWVWTRVEVVDWRRKDEPTKTEVMFLSYAGCGYSTKEMPRY